MTGWRWIPSSSICHEAFYDPILKGVERYDHKSTARKEQPAGLFKRPLDLTKLIVDPDPQGLEASRRRVDA